MALLLSPRRVAPGGVPAAPGRRHRGAGPMPRAGLWMPAGAPGVRLPRRRRARRALRRALAPAYSRSMSAPLHVAELERRLRWPGLPTLFFLGILTVLLTLAGISLWLRPEHPTGLPDAAPLLAAAGLPDPSLGVLTADLRFRAAALGGEPARRTSTAMELVHARDAERMLLHWTRRHPGEPRVRAALGALALVRHDYAAAAIHYR